MFGSKQTKLQKDLVILEEMAQQMSGYLRINALFGPMGPNRPKLTLGGYLMREQRLLALKTTLSQAEQDRLLKARQTFEDTVMEWIVATEKKAEQEMEARLRQWTETVRDLRESVPKYWPYYKTAVESRVMLQTLITMLSNPPFKFNSEIFDRLQVIDQGFYALWQSDASLFVWDEDWAAAYPAADYEFLYGKPRNLGIK
ncbi:MAG: hypothetical protein AAGD96_02955 [Chloroflexota bacterium]